MDEEHEQDVFARAMRPWLARTKVRSPLVTHITGLASGYFATMMHIPPGPPLALTTDGVGTKILLARRGQPWEPIGIDCVANNVNDVICVGAVPLALLDYMATDRIDEAVLEEVARGLYLGAEEAGIAIPGGEIAQIGAMLADCRGRAAHARPGRHRDRRAAPGARPGRRVAGQRRVTSSWPCPAPACTATGSRWPAGRCSRWPG